MNPKEFQKVMILKKMLELKQDLFGPISLSGRTQ